MLLYSYESSFTADLALLPERGECRVLRAAEIEGDDERYIYNMLSVILRR